MGNILAAVFFVVSCILTLCLFLLYRRKSADSSSGDRRLPLQSCIISDVKEIDKHFKKWRFGIDSLCDKLSEFFDTSGVTVYLAHGGDEEMAEIMTAKGTCRSWYTINDDNPEATSIVPSFDLPSARDLARAFIWSAHPQILDQADLELWVPKEELSRYDSAMAATVETPDGHAYLMLLRQTGREPFHVADRDAFQECIAIEQLALQLVCRKMTILELEDSLKSAQEEGMLQVSAGIIHNIGNGINVIQLGLENLESIKDVREVVGFLKNEILPSLSSHLQNGDIQEFLSTHKQGKEYLAALETLTTQALELSEGFAEQLSSVRSKFDNVADIIRLQQQFIGELGTEDVVTTTAIVQDVATMCKIQIEEQGISLETDTSYAAEILVDASLLRHIVLMVVKYACDSIHRVGRANAKITIDVRSTKETVENRPARDCVMIQLKENGYGIELNDQAFESFLERRNADTQTRDLLFCRERIEKYGGSFQIETHSGRGSTVSIALPIYNPDDHKE